jgi:hypothetical protein
MISYQQRLAVYTNLLAELHELELLRERVKKAELLLCTSRRTAVESRRGGALSRTTPRDSASTTNYRLQREHH